MTEEKPVFTDSENSKFSDSSNTSVFADLHIHSRYSRACSKNITIENLVKYAKIKGLGLLGTGDFTHPFWLKDIKEKLVEKNGLYYFQDFPFILTGEISLIYSQGGKGRRVHLVILVPSLEIVDRINAYLDTRGRRDYDGRPIFKISCAEFTKEMIKISQKIEIIPAHAWTPYFGIFGSMSGFDSLKEAFLDEEKNIHAIETGMSCYDSETEILTNQGWKKVSDVKKTDEVCTLNLEKDIIEFHKPQRLFKYSYNGKMYRLKTKRIDLLVTPNHKLLYNHCNFRKKPEFRLMEAEFLFNKSKRFKKNGRWIGENLDYFILPEVKIKHGSKYYSGLRNKKEKTFPIKDWLKFFGFWIAEGWTTEGRAGDYGVYLANSDSTIMNEMRKILLGFGFQPYFYKNRGLDTIRVRDYQLFSYLRQFGKSNEKHIPQGVKSLSKELLKILFDYYIKGDGHVYGREHKGLSATTISKKLRDDLQEIALKIGISAYFKLHNKKGTPILSLPKARVKGYKQSEDSWTIYFIRENIHTVMPSTIKKWGYIERWEDYKGFVYCIEAPNHVVYIRRNSIPVWCGNSDPEMNWNISELNNKSIISFSDSHSFWPWRLGREATIFSKIESYDNIISAIRENKILGTVETDPAYGKYHWDGHANCNFSCSPEQCRKLNNICPVCNRPLTIGVENRVEELKNQESYIYPRKKPFYKLLPLHELIALAKASTLASKKTWLVYNNLIEKFGNEFNILLNVGTNDLNKALPQDALLVQLIIDNRIGNIKVKPGYDGKYGEAMLKEKQQKISNF